MKNIWLIGAGGMALDYIKVLKVLKVPFSVIGRGEKSAQNFKKNTDCDVFIGGLSSFLSSNPLICSHAIVSVGVEQLFETTKKLLDYGVKNLLVEKPGALHKWQFNELNLLARENEANVLIAYNRRFYASVLAAQKIIDEDGGIQSFNFEFTEWSHKIEPLFKPKVIKEKWFLANSTHVVDLAFYLGGKPKEISYYTNGSLSWHPTASVFSGAGISSKNALFNYRANWESAGRWCVEVLTRKNKLIFEPMEKLQIQSTGTLKKEFVEIDYELDNLYKPGLFVQTRKFLSNDFKKICTIKEQTDMITVYEKMANY